MKTYDVTVRGIVTKTIRVEAETAEEAVSDAHDQFLLSDCNFHEDYDEETLNVEEVKS